MKLEQLIKNYNAEIDINGRAGGAYGHYLAVRILEQKEIEYLEQNLKQKDEYFIKQVNSLQLNVDNIFDNRILKENMIRKFKGYTRLNILGQKIKFKDKGDFLSNCSDSKIGQTFRNIYYSTLKKLEKQKNGKR